LNDKFKITLIKNDQIDSLSIFEVGDKTIINTNDCVLNNKKLNTIKKKTFIQKSDILFTQFSYASWIGNPKNNILRKQASKEKLDQIKSQIQFFKPKITIPFASYIYFCHEENKYMNDEITNIEKARDVIKENNSKPIFLYPGSVYEINNNKNSFESDFLKYKNDFLNINSKKFIKTKIINFEELKSNSKNYLKKIKNKNGSLIMNILCFISILSNFFFKKDFFGFSNTEIHLSDVNKYVEFNWINGLRR
jgi:UDP-MurNAc hydroxylase